MRIYTLAPSGHILREPWTFCCGPSGELPLVWSFGRIANWVTVPEDQPRVTVCRAKWWTSKLNGMRRPVTGPIDWFKTDKVTGEQRFTHRDPKPVYDMVRISTAKMIAWCLHGIEPDDGQQGPAPTRPDDRDVRAMNALRLRDEGLSQEKIAARLGITRQTVAKDLARAETLIDTL